MKPKDCQRMFLSTSSAHGGDRWHVSKFFNKPVVRTGKSISVAINGHPEPAKDLVQYTEILRSLRMTVVDSPVVTGVVPPIGAIHACVNYSLWCCNNEPFYATMGGMTIVKLWRYRIAKKNSGKIPVRYSQKGAGSGKINAGPNVS